MRLMGFAEDALLGARAEVLAWRLLAGPSRWPPQTVPFGRRFGILGVALLAAPVQAIGLAVATDMLPPGGSVPAFEFPALRAALASVADGEEGWRDVVAFGIAPFEQHLAPGDAIDGRPGGRCGVAGPRVYWTGPAGAPIEGLLTAGHVLDPGIGAAVLDHGGAAVGRVAAQVVPGTTGVDAGVVEATVALAGARSGGWTAPRGRFDIDIVTAKGTITGTVDRKLGWYDTQTHGIYDDVYQTTKVHTNRGDSGSAGLEHGSTRVIGVLVGSATGSLVQDVSTQFAALSHLPGLTLY